MKPLDDHQALVRPLFTSPHLQLVVDAVIAGNSPGLLWVDDATQPRAAALWDKSHSLYLAGLADNPAFNDAVSLFVAETVAQAVTVLKIYPASAAWASRVETLFPFMAFHQRDRVFYRLASPKISDWRERLPHGFRVSSINDQFPALEKLENFAALREEIASCWNALEDFQQRGFGFCAHNEVAIVCWCTAEYVSVAPGSAVQCGIGIETVAAYQQQGFAALTASAFAEYALAHGITAHWDAWQSNTPSVATAEKVGFTKLEDYRIYFGEFNPSRMA